MHFKTDLRNYFAIIWHWSWLLIVVTMGAGASAYAGSRQQQPVYEASTLILIDDAPSTSATSEYQSLLTSERRAHTYAELLLTEPLLTAVQQTLNLPLSVASLKSNIDVQSVPDTQLVRVKTRDTDPQRAATIANTLVVRFAEQTQERQASRYTASKERLEAQMTTLQQQIGETEQNLASLTGSVNKEAAHDRLDTLLAQYRQSYANLSQTYEQVRLAEAQTRSNIAHIEPATVPARPIAPRVLLNTLLAAVVGLLGALGIVFLKETLDDTVKSPEALAQTTGVPVLGMIAHMGKAHKQRLIVVAQPRSPVAEAFRALRTNLQFASVERPLRSLLITSPFPGEGKSEVATNLAAVLAQNGNTVTLVDADLRRPMLHKRLGVSNSIGLSDVFVNKDVTINESVRQTSINGVSVLTSGAIPPNPAELLGSTAMQTLLHDLQREADMVVVDAPPVVPVTDAVVLSQRVDGIVLVVRVGQTTMTGLCQTISQLQHAGAYVLGLVINDIPVGRSRYGYAYRGYYYNYQYGEHGSKRGRWRGWWRRKQQVEQSADAYS